MRRIEDAGTAMPGYADSVGQPVGARTAADIRVRDLKKHYTVAEREGGLLASLRSVVHRRHRVVRAFDGISFELDPGEIVGFLGPNGAGKTTSLKVLRGLLHPTGGERDLATARGLV